MDSEEENREEKKGQEQEQEQEQQNDASAGPSKKQSKKGRGRPRNKRKLNPKWESEGKRYRRQQKSLAVFNEKLPASVKEAKKKRRTANEAKRRTKPEVKKREKEKRAEREKDPAAREQILAAQKLRSAQRRANKEYAAQERERNREWWRCHASIATQEQFIKAITKGTKKERRVNSIVENECILTSFVLLICLSLGPTEVCSCCALIFMVAPTTTFTREQLHDRGLTDAVIEACLPVLAAQHQQQQAEDGNRRNEFKLCIPCRKKLFSEQKSMPLLCAASFILAPVPEEVADLNRNEEALVIPNQHALTRITLLKHRNANRCDGSDCSSTYVLSTEKSDAVLNRTVPREHSQTAIIQVPLADSHNAEEGELPVHHVVRPARVEAAAR